MRLLIFISLVFLISCTKELSAESQPRCGIVTDKVIKGVGTVAGAKKMYLILNNTDTVEVGLITYDKYFINDEYCK